jgi:CheY-like chemotaxis protein
MSQQQASLNPARVLIADDDQAIRQLVCTIVRREGLEVDCVADGMEAIDKLREHEYAVILLDLMMPRVDGFGVVEYLKTHAPRKKPVILVTTAYADQRFKEVDPTIVAGVIRKPFEVADLGNLVRLCVHGFDGITERPLSDTSEVALRDLAEKQWDQALEH